MILLLQGQKDAGKRNNTIDAESKNIYEWEDWNQIRSGEVSNKNLCKGEERKWQNTE